MTSVSEKVLKNIEKNHITPRPKWVFGLQNSVLWFLSVLLLLIGGLASSVVIYMIKDNDWGIYNNIDNSLFSFILLVFPYFWVVVLLGLIILANYNLKSTKKGYKYRLCTIGIFVLFISVLMGGILHMIGVGKMIDESFADRMPMYGQFVNKINHDNRMWMKPDQGLLAGMIISVDDENNFKVSDFNDDVWRIKGDKQTVFLGFDLGTNRGVKIVGEEVTDQDALAFGEKAFHAKMVEVMPDLDFVKRHPMGGRRIIEMHANVPDQTLPQNSFMQMEYKDATSSDSDYSINKLCEKDGDCLLPFLFAVRSSCPFEAKCIEKKCQVVCPINFGDQKAELDKKVQCKNNQDCDCGAYVANDKKDCVCFEDMCFAIVQ